MNFKINKDNWEKVTLGDVVFEPKETAKDIIAEGFAHIVGLEHIESGDVHLRNSFSNDTDTTFTKVFRAGDILFGRRRAYLKKAAQASFDGVCSGDITVMRANDKLDVRLLPFVIHNDKFFDYAVKHSAGGLSPRVKFKDLANYEFLLPPKAQQAELADLLWAMDNVIEKDLEVNTILGKTYNKFINEKIKKPTDSFYFFKELYSFRKGLTYKSEEYGDVDSGKPLLNLKSIARGGGFNKDGVKYYDGEYQDKHIVKNTDLVVACTDITRGGAVVGYPLHPQVYQDKEMLFTMDLIAIESKNDIFERDYMYYLLKTDWAHNFLFAYSPGTTVLHLDTDGLNRLKLPKVSVDIQREIIKDLKVMESMLEKIESKLQSSKALQKALINQVF